MFLIPLNQLESVELVIHSLKMAAGEADCSTCPAHKVCMKQCLTIASAVEDMLLSDALPQLDRPQSPLQPATAAEAETAAESEILPDLNPPKGRARLTVIK